MKKILVLEDNDDFVRLWRLKLSDFEIVSATTVLGALKQFANEPVENWVAIIVDGFLPASRHGSVFVERVRKQGYTGIMLAASSSEESQKLLLAAGCDHAAPAKTQVVETLRKLLS